MVAPTGNRAVAAPQTAIDLLVQVVKELVLIILVAFIFQLVLNIVYRLRVCASNSRHKPRRQAVVGFLLPRTLPALSGVGTIARASGTFIKPSRKTPVPIGEYTTPTSPNQP